MNGSSGWDYVLLQMFSLFISFATRSPISLGQSLIWNLVNFIMQVQTLGGLHRKKILGPKTCKVLSDFTQLQTLIANISGTSQDIQTRKNMWSTAIPSSDGRFGKKENDSIRVSSTNESIRFNSIRFTALSESPLTVHTRGSGLWSEVAGPVHRSHDWPVSQYMGHRCLGHRPALQQSC